MGGIAAAGRILCVKVAAQKIVCASLSVYIILQGECVLKSQDKFECACEK